MMRTILSASLAILTCSLAHGQNTEPLPSFEVASVKVSEAPKPDAQGRIFIRRGCSGGLLPRSNDPGTMTCNNTPLKELVVAAYGLKDYQVEGPAWIETDGYEITAKVPKGTTAEQFQLMMQQLLAERFKVTVHRETKSMQVYVLSVGKNGPKLKEVDAATLEAAKAAAAAGPAPGRGAPGQAPMPPPLPGAGTMTFSTGVGPMMAGRGSPPPKGVGPRTSMSMGPGGMRRTLSGYLTIAQVVTSLSNMLDRPVTDLTELKGTYDIDLAWVPDGNDANIGGGMRAALTMAGGMAGAGGSAAAPDSASEPGLNLPEALQATLGLKLEQKKAPAEMLIVDHAEKTPIEN